MNQRFIRNFAIIAHIDHGKSTLADRLLEMTGTVAKRAMQEQILDSNPIERERGITIKLAPVRMEYKNGAQVSKDGPASNKKASDTFDTSAASDTFILNLIDTPGHVDFGYEVSRSLAACEGAVLVVDASQGVQAQTLANLHQARANNLTIIPVINKIDLPNARIREVTSELQELGFGEEEVLRISAKTGENVGALLQAIVTRIPPPQGIPSGILRALVFSSQYDAHKGVVVFVRVVDGRVGAGESFFGDVRKDFPHATPKFPSSLIEARPPDGADQRIGVHRSGFSAPQNARPHPSGKGGENLCFMASGTVVTPIEIGYFTPKMTPAATLSAGEVGYIATGLKNAKLAKVGDTITVGKREKVAHVAKVAKEKTSDSSAASAAFDTFDASATSDPPAASLSPLPGYREPKSMVFLSLFPIVSDEFTQAREAMEKLRLSDSAFTFRPISSLALGNGFHCGFLGLLHAEIVQERLSREFDLHMLATAPSVEYRVRLKAGVSPAKHGLKPTEESGAGGAVVVIQSASEYPDPSIIEEVKEPVMEVKIFTPKPYVGAVMQLSVEKRGEYIDLRYVGEQAEFTYLMPLAEMIVDFFDRLKSISEGYASLDYAFFDFQSVDVVRIDILVNKVSVDALSFLAVRTQAHSRGIAIVDRLAQVIPRQQFEIPIQAAIGGQIVARSNVKAFRKDVTKKLYGGDRTRKDKLLKKQAKGKAKMKLIGRVEIPQSAFFEVLRRE